MFSGRHALRRLFAFPVASRSETLDIGFLDVSRSTDDFGWEFSDEVCSYHMISMPDKTNIPCTDWGSTPVAQTESVSRLPRNSTGRDVVTIALCALSEGAEMGEPC